MPVENRVNQNRASAQPARASKPAKPPTSVTTAMRAQRSMPVHEMATMIRLATVLAKGVRSAQLYPLQNPVCRRAANDIAEQMNAVLKKRASIRFSIGTTKIYLAGEVILNQEREADALAGRLFRSGIREITFHKGLQEDEILRFLSVFHRDDRSLSRGEDDLVTLLWEKHLTHVTYIVLDDFLIDLENDDDPVPEEFGKDFMHFVDLEVHDFNDTEDVQEQANKMAEDIRARIEADDLDLFTVTQEERQDILKQLQDEESPRRSMDDFCHIVSEILAFEQDSSAFVDLVRILGDVLREWIAQGELSQASSVIKILCELRDARNDLAPEMLGELDSGMLGAWNQDALEAVTEHLDAESSAAIDGLDTFVQTLPESALGGICEVLGKVEVARVRRKLIDALIKKARGKVDPFLPFLNDSRWYLIRNIALILGEIGNLSAVTQLKRLLAHDDFRVRRETLSAIEKLSPSQALLSFSDALADSDSRIRTFAARSIGTKGEAGAQHLLAAVEAKEFEKRDLSEIQAFYESIGYSGGSVARAYLEKIVKRSNPLRRQHIDELRAAACEGLGCSGDPAALPILKRLQKDRSAIIRSAAQSGLRRLSATKESTDSKREVA